MPAVRNLEGIRFGRLVVVRKVRRETGRKKVRWECLCDCGGCTTTSTDHLTSGKTKSCGCYMRQRSSEAAKITNAKRVPKHGLAHTRLWKTWHAMHRRCRNPNDIGFKNYGARGICICPEWYSIENFLADMGHPPDGCSLERINNDLGYCKENCKWATRLEQSNNTRGNRRITCEGVTLTAAQWARELGVSYPRFMYRLKVVKNDAEAVRFFKLREARNGCSFE